MGLDPNGWRPIFYPLGFLASLIFGLRFLLQWLRSEKRGRSVVDSSFWKLSLLGNSLMGLHYFIQVHFFLCLIQLCNGFLAWRNLQLLHREKALSAMERLASVAAIGASCTLAFMIQSWLSMGALHWVPAPYLEPHQIELGWHLIGFAGACLFSLRFWLQWWQAEGRGQSQIEPWFWRLSFIGALIVALYAYKIDDPVTLLSNSLPLIGYLRNLLLLKARRV